MKITYMNMFEIEEFEELDRELEGYYEILIIELDNLTKEEEKFFKKNNIIYRTNNGKIEIFILSFLNYFVEYNSDSKEGIYFEKTKGYYKYYEDSYYIDKMSEKEPNLVICKDGLKFEVIIILEKKAIKFDKNFYNKYLVNKEIFKIGKNLALEENDENINLEKPFNRFKFETIHFGKVIYEKDKLTVIYRHRHGEYKDKKLVFKNIKNARTRLRTFPYYETLLDKIDYNENSIKIGFYKMINRASKYNELYLIDVHFNRIIIKFND